MLLAFAVVAESPAWADPTGNIDASAIAPRPCEALARKARRASVVLSSSIGCIRHLPLVSRHRLAQIQQERSDLRPRRVLGHWQLRVARRFARRQIVAS